MKKSLTMYALGWAGYSHMLNPSPLVTGPYALFVNKTNAEEFKRSPGQKIVKVKVVIKSVSPPNTASSQRGAGQGKSKSKRSTAPRG